MSDEVQYYPIPRIAIDDFAEFVEILAGDEDFPNTHTEWTVLCHLRSVELADEGYNAKFLEVRPAGFRRFLKETGGSPSMDGLAAYVAMLATYKR